MAVGKSLIGKSFLLCIAVAMALLVAHGSMGGTSATPGEAHAQSGPSAREDALRLAFHAQAELRSHDDEGLVAPATTPLGRTTARGRAQLGHITARTDPLGHTVTFTRDAMGRVPAITPRPGRPPPRTPTTPGPVTGRTAGHGGRALCDPRAAPAQRRDRQGDASVGLHARNRADRWVHLGRNGRDPTRADADPGGRHVDPLGACRSGGDDLGIAQSVRG